MAIITEIHTMDGSKGKTYRATRRLPAPAEGLLRQNPPPLVFVLEFAPTDFAPLPPNGLKDNLLLASTRGKDLQLTLAIDQLVVFPIDEIQLELNGTPVGSPHAVTPTEYGASLVSLTLEATAMDAQPEGRVEINYQVRFFSGLGGTGIGPLGQYYITDYTPEGLPFLGAPTFAPDVIANGVIPEVLQLDGTNREYLGASIPSYNHKTSGDTITGTIDGVESPESLVVNDVTVPTEVAYLRTFIEAQNDGPHDFGYIVTDRAGNVSAQSREVSLNSLLKDYIPNLPEPLVPAYDADVAPAPKLIDEADARKTGGLEVTIPGHPLIAPTDQIEVHWGTRDATRVPGATSTPITVLLPYEIVSDEWYAGGAPADQARPVDVSYTVWRNNISRGTSDPHPVEVNLFVAGGQDPDPTTPVNENLAVPKVVADSGAENELSGPDFAADATVTVPWLLEGSATVTPFVAGDIVTVHYGTSDLAPRTIIAADVTAAVDIDDIVLPSTIIGTVGSGTVPLNYTIDRALGAGGPNPSHSPAQDVLVSGSDRLPGGGNPLLPGSIPEADGSHPSDPNRKMIGRREAADGVDFVIPHYANQDPGDSITVTALAFLPFYATHPTDIALAVRNFTVADRHPADDTNDVSIHIDESILMRYDLGEGGFHFHITYSVKGVADPTTPVVSTDPYLVDVDSRGTQP